MNASTEDWEMPATMSAHKKLTQQLQESRERLFAEGILLPNDRLEGYYATFRERFGPDRLRDLDGEALLNLMHEHGNRDSLVYWLEFKNDEEFPTRKFGSISGGSALKFGIYKRNETGAWMTGHPSNQQEISIAQAVEVARKHRDQLLAGVQAVADIVEAATDEDYAALQQKLFQVAPDVCETGWGHKYLFLLNPARLDDFHSADYHHFYPIKLLQTPPEPGGRYAGAGHFVRLARELNLSLPSLTVLLEEQFGRPYRYWRVGTRDGGTRQTQWQAMREEDHVAVGWGQLGDLSGIERNSADKARVRALMAEHYPNTPQAVGRATQQVFNFKVAVAEGDLIVACDGATVLGISRVTGPYVYDPSVDFGHQHPVEWLSLEEWKLPQPEGLRTTLREFRNVTNLVEIERRILEAPPRDIGPGPNIPGPDPNPPVPGPRRKPLRLTGIPSRLQAILDRKRQVILYGPPGTGKTYWATRTARDLAGYSAFGLPFEGLNADQRAALLGDAGTRGLVRTCTFHPAYGYEDFLEGYRPESVNGQLVFQRRDGIFKQLCEDARQEPDRRFYLIIDEINRGDIPRIFGELLTILEHDKRNQAVLLPMSGAPFTVPDNVYIVGTMNTADRSIALLDTALRRRFGFVELMPDPKLLGDTVIGEIPLGLWLNELNRRICEFIGRDARNLQIGHAYLLENGLSIRDIGKLASVLQDDIVPLLEEYCYEDYDTLDKILGSGLVDAARQRIRHEIFEPARQDDLIQALLAPSPEIVTSAKAIEEAEEIADELDDEDNSSETEIGPQDAT